MNKQRDVTTGTEEKNNRSRDDNGLVFHGKTTAAAAAVLMACYSYEKRLQRKLTRPPVVLGQLPPGTQIHDIYSILSSTPESILRRPIIPSFGIGTRAQLSSTAAYLRGGTTNDKTQFLKFREVLTMTMDGAQIGIDWEIPLLSKKDGGGAASNTKVAESTRTARRAEIEKGPIKQPVVVILHGINNHSRFGYIQSLQREIATRGWNACAMNFRGCGHVPMTTPRSYHAAYTGDIRCVVQQLSSRMANNNVPIFLIGNSLGANIVTKYLGEEGLAGSLPECVAGGISLGNPLLATYLEHWHAIKNMNDSAWQTAKRKGLVSMTLGQLDKAAAPLMIRNDPYPPFSTKIGYESGYDYWMDSGCYEMMRFISIPFLMVSAEDDFLCYQSTQRCLGYALSNPNIMLVETRTGGHLGWQERSPNKGSGSLFDSSSWSDVAAAEFIDATLKTRAGKASNDVQRDIPDMHLWFSIRPRL